MLYLLDANILIDANRDYCALPGSGLISALPDSGGGPSQYADGLSSG